MFERATIDMAGYQRRAVYSDDERRRLMLDIELESHASRRADSKYVVFLMLNPSTATEEQNDPTVRKCIKFARRFGGDVLTVVNIFDWRDTHPKAMKRAAEPEGPAADAAIIGACLGAHLVIAAWGRNGDHQKRGARVREMLRELGVALHWLRDPRLPDVDEDPLHPLYLYDGCVPERLE